MRRQQGSAAVELVLVTPVLLALLLLVVAGGRIAQARAAVDGAARSAARAAAIARDPHTAVTAGERAAADRLAAATRVACPAPEVTIDAGRLEPGGTVGATVTCEVPLTDLAGLRLPATLTLTRSFAEPVDTHRGASA